MILDIVNGPNPQEGEKKLKGSGSGKAPVRKMRPGRGKQSGGHKELCRDNGPEKEKGPNRENIDKGSHCRNKCAYIDKTRDRDKKQSIYERPNRDKKPVRYKKPEKDKSSICGKIFKAPGRDKTPYKPARYIELDRENEIGNDKEPGRDARDVKPNGDNGSNKDKKPDIGKKPNSDEKPDRNKRPTGNIKLDRDKENGRDTCKRTDNDEIGGLKDKGSIRDGEQSTFKGPYRDKDPAMDKESDRGDGMGRDKRPQDRDKENIPDRDKGPEKVHNNRWIWMISIMIWVI